LAEHVLINLGDDLPKENPWLHDKLGYAPFAKRIFRIISSVRAPNGYVIGVHGRWGSGKSTALNFVKAYIEKHNQEIVSEEEKLFVIDFKPWIVSGHQDLMAAFFKILSESLETPATRRKKTWIRRLLALESSAEGLVDAAAKLALIVDVSGGLASKFAGDVAKHSIGRTMKGFRDAPSLQKAYLDLRDQLRRRRQRFVVIIDDIDRLQQEEIQSILQMVKTTGQLPNVIYILSYDRELVYSAVDENRASERPNFAEKIVQQEIDLPHPSTSALLSMLDDEISFLIGPTEPTTRWAFIIRDGIQRWIRSPRDVVRISNAVKFTAPALDGELDPHDILAMEGIRLFDTAAFQWIRENRDFLFRNGRYLLANEETRAGVIERLRSALPDHARDEILSFLLLLFPSLRSDVDNNSFAQTESRADLHARRGIATEAGYDSYFSLHPSANFVLKSTIDALVRSNDSEEVKNLIVTSVETKTREGRVLVGDLLLELRFRVASSEGTKPQEALLKGLFDAGDVVAQIEWSGEMLSVEPVANVSFLIADILETWGETKAGEYLLRSALLTDNISTVAQTYIDIGQKRGLFGSDPKSEKLISDDDFGRLGALIKQKINEAARDGSLAGAGRYGAIIAAWRYLSGPTEPRLWVAENFEGTAEQAVKVANSILTRSSSGRGISYRLEREPDRELYEVSALQEGARKHLQEKQLSSDHRRILEAVANGIVSRDGEEG
jgi:hypothetical protein